jgi:hypothetical protein
VADQAISDPPEDGSAGTQEVNGGAFQFFAAKEVVMQALSLGGGKIN